MKIVEKLQHQLDQLGCKTRAEKILRAAAAASILSAATSALLFSKSPLLFAAIALSLSPTLFAFLVPKYLCEKRKKRLEASLVDALYHASSLSAFLSFEEIFRTLADSGYGPLSQEFSRARNEIRSGASVEDALQNIASRNGSQLLSRAVDVLVLGYRTGADISDALKETADDAAQAFAAHKELAAAITVEKYTLLFAGGLIVPIILGTMVSLVSSLDLGTLAEFGLGLDAGTKKQLLANAVLGNQIYVGIYAVLASLFAGFQENKIENAFVYALFLLPAAVLLFSAAMNSRLF